MSVSVATGWCSAHADRALVRELLAESWRRKAPKKVLKKYDG
jgi:hypothetical protein